MSMTDRKMKGKQAIEGGFDLNAFVAGATPDEEVATEAIKSAPTVRKSEKVVTPPAKDVEPKLESASVKAKTTVPQRENLSVRLQVRITQSEFDALEKKAGLIPHSAFLRQFLKEHGLF